MLYISFEIAIKGVTNPVIVFLHRLMRIISFGLSCISRICNLWMLLLDYIWPLPARLLSDLRQIPLKPTFKEQD